MDTLSKKNLCLFSAQTNAFINYFLWSSPLENCATFFASKKKRRTKSENKRQEKEEKTRL